MVESKYDLIVVGAGLIGSVFALSMSKRSDMRIAVVERGRQIKDRGPENQRVLALGEAASNLLNDVGVFELLSDASRNAYKKMFVWDQKTDGELVFDAQDYKRERLGFMVDALECTRLVQRAMENADNIDTYYEFVAQSLNIEEVEDALRNSSIKRAREMSRCSSGQISVALEGEQLLLKAPLIVAADGKNSWVRQTAKIFSHQYDYSQRGIVAKIRTELDHENTAWQRFLETGPLAVLPLSDNQSSIVWSADLERAAELMTLSKKEFTAELENALQGRLGKVEVLTDLMSFPLVSQKAERYFKKGLVLVGDAAHSIHPLAGQGANLGFKDVAALADILGSVYHVERNSRGFGRLDVLQRYQRARFADNQQTDRLMSALHMAFKHNSPWWLSTRSVGMNWISRSSNIKQLLVKQAMGF